MLCTTSGVLDSSPPIAEFWRPSFPRNNDFSTFKISSREATPPPVFSPFWRRLCFSLRSRLPPPRSSSLAFLSCSYLPGPHSVFRLPADLPLNPGPTFTLRNCPRSKSLLRPVIFSKRRFDASQCLCLFFFLLGESAPLLRFGQCSIPKEGKCPPSL